MSTQIPAKSTRDLKRILPGILVSLAALILVFTIVDLGDVMRALTQASYKYLLLGMPIYLAGYGFRALAWHTLLNGEVSYSEVFLTMQAGYLLNNVLPLRLGELGRAFLLGQKGLGFWRVFSTIVIERAFDMILAAGMLLGAVPFVFGSAQSSRVALLVAGVILLGFVCLHLLARYQHWAIDKFEQISARWRFLSRFGVQRLSGFLQGLSVLTEFKRFLEVMFWMVLTWGITILYHYVVLLAFLPDAKILWAVFGLGTAALGVALPSSPSYIGIVEAAWVGALSFFDVPYATALAYALTVHVLHILVSVVFGVPALSKAGESFGRIYQELRERRMR